MNVSKQQQQILSVAISLPGPFKAKDIEQRTGLSAGTVATQLHRLVLKNIVAKDRLNKTYTVTDEARKEWMSMPQESAETMPGLPTMETQKVGSNVIYIIINL